MLIMSASPVLVSLNSSYWLSSVSLFLLLAFPISFSFSHPLFSSSLPLLSRFYSFSIPSLSLVTPHVLLATSLAWSGSLLLSSRSSLPSYVPKSSNFVLILHILVYFFPLLDFFLSSLALPFLLWLFTFLSLFFFFWFPLLSWLFTSFVLALFPLSCLLHSLI